MKIIHSLEQHKPGRERRLCDGDKEKIGSSDEIEVEVKRSSRLLNARVMTQK